MTTENNMSVHSALLTDVLTQVDQPRKPEQGEPDSEKLQAIVLSCEACRDEIESGEWPRRHVESLVVHVAPVDDRCSEVYVECTRHHKLLAQLGSGCIISRDFHFHKRPYSHTNREPA